MQRVNVAGIAGRDWSGAGKSFRHFTVLLTRSDLIARHLLSPCTCAPLASLLLALEAMNAGYATAIAALAGAALGGLTSFASSWTTLHAQMKAQRLASSKSTRQELYKQFIDEASRTYVDALVHDKLEVSGLVGIYSLVSRMRLLSSQKVIESAAVLVRVITDTYFQPNKTLAELQAMIHDGAVDPLRDFSEVCRNELESDLLTKTCVCR